MQAQKQKITPEIAIRILKEHGTLVTVREAELILEFMYTFAKLALNQQLYK